MKVFVSGKPKVGKTTLVLELLDELRHKNVAGLIAPEIKDKKREGFFLQDIASKEKVLMASTKIRKNRVSKYGVDVKAIDRIVRKVSESVDKADIVVIDEIGKMEMKSKAFREFIDKVLNSEKNVIAVVHRNFVSLYKNKGIFFWLDRKNFEKIKEKILSLLR